jgi:hypothetical protein
MSLVVNAIKKHYVKHNDKQNMILLIQVEKGKQNVTDTKSFWALCQLEESISLHK